MNRRNPTRAVGAIVASATIAALSMTVSPAYGQTEAAIGALAPDFKALGSDGGQHRLSDYRGSTVVLEWTSPVCEFSAQQYDSGSMQGLQKDAAMHKVVWLSIDTAAAGKPGYLTAEGAIALTKKRGAEIAAFLFDTGGSIGRAFGAKTTPAAFIIDAKGTLVYKGAIDDGSGGSPLKAHNYVQTALSEIRTGKPVSTPLTKQHGCAVEY